ncbi:MAG: hypothetical protein ACLRSW_13100 [Christensenellaceae bacterium]
MGLFLMAAMLRIVFSVSLSVLLAICYTAVFALASRQFRRVSGQFPSTRESRRDP